MGSILELHSAGRQDVCCGSTSFACSPTPPTFIRLRLNGFCTKRAYHWYRKSVGLRLSIFEPIRMKDTAHDEYMAATYRSNPRYAACIFKELMFSAASPRELAIFFGK